MKYKELAHEYIKSLCLLDFTKHQKNTREYMRGEAMIIQFLSQANRPLIPSEISNAMALTSARIAAALNKLEDKNLITRKIDLKDRRKILVELTPQGQDLAQENKKMLVAHTSKLLSLLSEDEAEDYVRLTTLLASRAVEFNN